MEHINVNQRFYKDGNEIAIIEIPPIDKIFVDIPTNTYKFVVEKLPQGLKYKLQIIPPFMLPPKIYDNAEERANRVINTYLNKSQNIGVCLYGQSGGGKSLLAKLICNKLSKLGNIPIITIEADAVHHLPSILGKITQPCIFFLDEFEKMFQRKEEQSFLLSILDGIYQTNHLFLLTGNKQDLISPYFFNRPSRLRYVWEYKGLSKEVIDEILKDNVDDVQRRTKILDLMYRTVNLSFDTLYSFIDECKMYPDIEPDKLFVGFNAFENTRYLKADYEFNIYIGNNTLQSAITTLDERLNGVLLKLDTNVYRNQFVLSDIINYKDNAIHDVGALELQVFTGRHTNKYNFNVSISNIRNPVLTESSIEFNASLSSNAIEEFTMRVISDLFRVDNYIETPNDKESNRSDKSSLQRKLKALLTEEVKFVLHRFKPEEARKARLNDFDDF